MPDHAGLTDTHLHLWDLSGGGYGWLAGAPEGLRRDVRWEDVAPQLAAVGVRRVVLVQADDTRTDTLAMQAAAERIEAGTIPGGSGGVERVDVVAWLPLDDPHEVAQLLDDPAAMHRVVGVRHLVHDDPDPGFLDRATVRRSLQLLAARGLPLDVPDAYPRHLQQATRVAREVPDLTVVLDHLAKPPFGDAAAMRQWEEQLREAAEVPTVVAKVSGLSTSGRGPGPGDVARVLEVALDAFGAERLMFGSDWPIAPVPLDLRSGVQELLDAVDALEEPVRDRLRHRTAARVYRRVEERTPSR